MSENQEGEISDSVSEPEQKNTTIAEKGHRIKKTGRHPHQRHSKFVSSNYRTQKCDFFNKGHCLKGKDCTYRHDFIPDTAKKICKFFLSGACTKDNCPYSHNTKIYPCRFYHIDKACQAKANCRFSHDPIPRDFYDEYMKDNKDHILKLYKDKRLFNEALMDFIKDDIPKKELSPPPITLLPPPEPVTKQTPKKDPRLKLLKQVATSPPEQQRPKLTRAVPHDPRLKRQEKQQQNATEQQNATFYKHIKQFFFSYY